MFGISASLLPLGYLTTDWSLLAAVLQMLVMVFAGIVLQGFVVDLVRRLNPEKQGNVYDVKFRKKWLSSCDEAERQQIGQAAYVSFTVSNYTGLLVWVAMLVINTLIPIGPLAHPRGDDSLGRRAVCLPGRVHPHEPEVPPLNLRAAPLSIP